LEQPVTRFNHKVYALVEGATPGDGGVWSTVREVNNFAGYDDVRMPKVTAAAVDDNMDGVNDAYTINCTLALRAGEKVHRVTFLAFFDYQINDRVRLRMEGVAMLRAESVLPGARLDAFGNLRLRQRHPLLTTGGDRTIYSTDTVLDGNSIAGAEDTSVPSILGTWCSCSHVTPPYTLCNFSHVTLRLTRSAIVAM
jgi:hypothetical protein